MLKWFITAFIAVIITYLLLAVVLSIIGTTKEPATTSDVAIYIMTNGDHTDMAIPVKTNWKDWRSEISYKNTIDKDTTTPYVAIGWGNQDFYLHTPTWAQLKCSTAIKAIMGLGPAAIHTDFCKDLQETDNCKKITLSKLQYSHLVEYIENSLKKDKNGKVINIKTKSNYDHTDAFYEANGTYSLFYTCNTWANSALKACGQAACLWTPFDRGIFYHYR